MAGLSFNTSIFSLIRLPNLLIVGLVQGIVFYYILQPVYEAAGISMRMDYVRLLMLMLVTICITAGGYIINDIVDQQTDLINKPAKLVVGKLMTTQTAYWLYFGFLLLGFALAFYLALIAAPVALLALYPLAQAGLYLYAVQLKKRPLSGNILVSLYCAASAGILWIAEWAGYQELNRIAPDAAATMTRLLMYYLLLAFFTTLFRELIKDLQDEPGDRQTGAQTLPIVLGIQPTKLLVQVSGLIILGLMAGLYIQFSAVFHVQFTLPTFIIIAASITYTMIYLRKAASQAAYGRLSALAKWIILSGLLLPVLISL
jgi:4-hydroxybenzoate polyprenyltransferase